MDCEWKIRGIRGATTVESNSVEQIDEATVELLKEIIERNNLNTDDIGHVIFTLTHDLNATFPARVARTELVWDDIPMICTQEIPVPNSLQKCIRVLISVNTKADKAQIKHVYLRGAKALRPDLSSKY